jgi:hypothetical protein
VHLDKPIVHVPMLGLMLVGAMAGGPLGSALVGVLVTRSLSGTFLGAALATVLAAAAVALIPSCDRGVRA